LHQLDEDNSDLVMKIVPAGELNDLPKGRPLRVAADRRRIATDPPLGNILVLRGRFDLRIPRDADQRSELMSITIPK